MAGERISSFTASEIQEILGCRAQPDREARLACFDATSTALANAVALGKVQVSAGPQFGLPAGRTADQKAEMTGTIRIARSTREGWVITLEDGSVWRQVDSAQSAVDPVVGQKVTIRRAALGSFRLMLNSNVGFKVQRMK